MQHLDLFSGIGGFAYAADQVWDDVEHIFCDNDKFCREVLAKHWPSSKIYEDIRLITDSVSERLEGGSQQSELSQPAKIAGQIGLLTGGFPCQPFSQAGRRGGTDDDRYLWPEMLRVIQLTKPTWVIAENVRGLLTINEGMVFEQVCLDLENEGYEVQPFLIPAVSVNAPHRRDRVWFIANKSSKGLERGNWSPVERCTKSNSNVTDTSRTRSTSGLSGQINGEKGNSGISDNGSKEQFGWETNWLEVATRFCGVDDGLPRRVDRLKSLGNAIVPAVAIELLKAIQYNDESMQ